jgi:multidrug efflux pump subunit AcrA (membrane-fusion protein)
VDAAAGQDPDEDPQVAQLRQQLEALQAQQAQSTQAQMEWIQRQQFEQEVANTQSQLESEVQALKAGGADDRTIKAVIDRAELHHFRGGKPRPLAEIHAELVQEQQFIRNQPQAVDRAPRLPGVTGGSPTGGTVDMSTATREQSIDTLAAFISANKGR